MQCARFYRDDEADNWLVKDDTEANELMEYGNEIHSVIVPAAKKLLELS